jgi:hypothetical protein
MISCPASATWSHLVLSLCCTKHGSSRGAIRSGRISTVAMFRSGQLDIRCAVEPNCSGLSTRPADASVTRDRALDTCKPSCVPEVARPSLFLWSTACWGSWGTWQHRSSPLSEVRSGPRDSVGAHLGREARSEAEEHVTAPELSSRKAEPVAMGHVAAMEPTLAGRRGPELRNT